MINIPEISWKVIQEDVSKTRGVPPKDEEIDQLHKAINQDLHTRAHSFADEGQEPTQQMWDRAYEEIYREEILMEDDEDWDPGWTGPTMYFGAPTHNEGQSRPEILLSTVSRMLTATSPTPPTHQEVSRRHAEINQMIKEGARSLAQPGEEPTQQMWEQAYEEVLHSEIQIPMRGLSDDEADPWDLTPEQEVQIEAEAEAVAEAWEKMNHEERREYAHQMRLQWLRSRLEWWLRKRPEVSLDDPQVFEETLNILWKTTLQDLQISKDAMFSEMQEQMETYLAERFPTITYQDKG